MKCLNRGFTLLELLVVLTLIGIIAGMVGPRLFSVADKLRYRNELQSMQLAINALPVDALLSGRPRIIDTHGAADLQLPDGWHVMAKKPIRYQTNGICLGGELVVLHGDSIVSQLNLEAPYCQWRERE